MQHTWRRDSRPLNAYKSLPHPPLGKSDHSFVLLLPAYRQKLKRETPNLRTIQLWSDQSDPMLQDCFDYVDWDMFRAASDDDIDVYTDTVTCFIRKCIEDVVPTKTIRTYPNQKPWINADVCTALNARTTAFNSGNMDDYKQASYTRHKTIKTAKHKYKEKLKHSSPLPTTETYGKDSTPSRTTRIANTLLQTPVPHYMTSSTPSTLVLKSVAPPTHRALPRMKRLVHSSCL